MKFDSFRRLGACWGICVVLTLQAVTPVAAHELQGSRATLVQRGPSFVTLTLYVDLPAVLHHALAPQQTFAQFAAAQVNLPPKAFAAALLQAAKQLQNEAQVTTKDDQALAFTHWAWPDAALVQAAMRERLMEAVVAPSVHPSAAPSEVYAELHTEQPISTLNLRFPPEFGRVLVVSYRPNQLWVDPGKRSSVIQF